jgi:hypothetical protein
MTTPAKGYRDPNDEALFRTASENPAVVPDRVSPAVEGYFRIPAVWIGNAPDASEIAVLNPIVHHATALRKQLVCGIEVRVSATAYSSSTSPRGRSRRSPSSQDT